MTGGLDTSSGAAGSHLENVAPPAPRRRRPALSCQQCRKSKVRCDRSLPTCLRCLQTGRGAECAYRDDALHRVVNSKPAAKQRVASKFPSPAESSYHPRSVEGGGHVISIAHSQDAATPATNTPVLGTTFLQEGAGSQTRFFGQSHTMNMYSQFEGIRKHSRAIKSRNPIFEKLRNDFQPLKSATLNDTGIELSSPLGLLPPADTTKHYLDIYLRLVEPIYNILHIPTFTTDLAIFEQNRSYTPTAFTLQLLLITSIGSILDQTDSDVPQNATSKVAQTNAECVKVAESWIQQYSHRPDLTLLRIFCLLVISKRLNGLGTSQAWIATGHLVKLAMSIGYHRELGQMDKISQLDQELRRRMWATIVELDLQTCVDRGMPPSVKEEDYDISPPSNINDEAVLNTTDQLLVSQPKDVFTSSSFQCAMIQSLSTRLKICATINRPVIHMEYDEVLRLDAEMTQYIQEIPSWSLGASDEISQDDAFLKSILDSTLHQWCIILHTPYACKARQNPTYVHSRRARLEAATRVLCQHQETFRSDSTTLVFLRQGALMAALALLHEFHMDDLGYGSTPIRQGLPVVVESLMSLAEGVLPMLETAVVTTGKGLNEYYVLVMVLSLVKIQLWPATAAAIRTTASDQIITLGCKLYSRKPVIQPQATSTMVSSETRPLYPDYSDNEAHHRSIHDAVRHEGQWIFAIPDDFDVSDEIGFGDFDIWNFGDSLGI